VAPPGAAAATAARPAPTQTIEEAAAAGDPAATFELGQRNLVGADRTLGVTLIRRAANQGFPPAQYRLAKMHERGEGVPRDIAEARRWTERAAAAGNRAAMHDLGVYYANGEGVQASMSTAAEWFRRAAELGLADSQFNMGELFERGLGVSQNLPEAYVWFRIAARNGDQEAGRRAQAIAANLPPDQVAALARRAETFRPRPLDARANGNYARNWATAPASPQTRG
jgi:localization factor PodJL